ncbi:MAG: CBS domain-containing protein [Gammaproteobacteria bacterium]|nr:CBS domain-containing protein [Gammaproteobacteria bacterium]
MLAKDVMTRDVATVTPETRVEDIAKLLLRRDISGVPVVDARGRLVGMVSEGDLIRRGETEGRRSWWLNLLTGPEERARDYLKAHGGHAEDVMTREVVSVSEETPVGEIARILERRRIKRVPVVRDGKLVGIVSRANLLHGLASHRERISIAPSPDDRTIREKILALVKREGWITHGALNVIVNEGVVELWGWVDSRDERKALMAAVEGIEGVKKVNDHLGSVAPYLGMT